MKKEDLLRALGDVGEDLLHMAEHKKFYNQWKRWASLAACLALVVSLSVLALPYFPIGCGASMEKSEAEAPMESPTMDCMVEESIVEDYEFKTKEEPMEEEAAAESVTQEEGCCIHVGDYTAQDVQDAFDRGDHQWILETFVAPHEDIEGLYVKRVSVEDDIAWIWVGYPEPYGPHGYDEKQYKIRFYEPGWGYLEISEPG